LKRIAPFLSICALASSATIIDRVAVSVGNRAIAASDIVREIRIAAFLNGVKADFSSSTRRSTADRLVEQTLVRMEVETSRYPAPTGAEVQTVLDQFKKEHFADDAAYQHALTDYGITEQDVLIELTWQRTLLSYVDIRFRPAVQVSDQEIQDYFQKTVKPAAEAAHPGRQPSLDENRDQIEETLASLKEDDELNRWLAQAKQRYEIVYHDEAFQ
jgi:peptidyl-prolyl cis-trans isomerase SurA